MRGPGPAEPRWNAARSPTSRELTLHNGTIYRWNRPVYDIDHGRPHLRVENRVLPAGPDRRRHHGERRVLLRRRPRPRRRGDARCGARMPFARRRREPARRRRATAWTPRRTGPALGQVPVTELVLRRLLPAGRHRPGPVGRRRGRTGPAARHHRATLPDQAQRRDLAGRDGALEQRGPAGGAPADDAALHRAHAQQRTGAHLADRLLKVALDLAGGPGRGVVGVLPGVTAGPPLAEEVPAAGRARARARSSRRCSSARSGHRRCSRSRSVCSSSTRASIRPRISLSACSITSRHQSDSSRRREAGLRTSRSLRRTGGRSAPPSRGPA